MLVALARADDQLSAALSNGEVIRPEATELTHTDPRMSQGCQDRQVSRVPGSLTGPQQLVYLSLLQPLGGSGGRRYPFDPIGRILAQHPLGDGPLAELAHRGQAALDRGWGPAFNVEQVRTVVPDVGGGDRGRGEGLSGGTLELLAEVEQVETVVAQGQWSCPLQGQGLDKFVE